MVSGVLIAGPLVSLPKSLAEVAKMDAWFSQLLPVLYAILVAYVFAQLIKAFPGKNLFDIFYLLAGKWIGGLINIAVLIYLWMLLVRDTKGITNFVHLTLLPKTPMEIILLLFLLVLLYYGKTSVEVAARVNEMYFPIFFLMTLTLYFTLANEYSLERLEPILGSSLEGIFYSNLMGIGSFGDVFLFGAFLHTVTNSRLLHASMRHGILIAGFIITMVLIIQLGVMGHIITSRLNFPLYVLVEQIHLTDFLDRVEVLLFSVWFPAFAIKVIVTYLAFVLGISSLVGHLEHSPFNISAGWMLVATSLVSFPRVNDVNDFVSYSLPLIVLTLQPPLLLLLYLGARTRHKGSQDHQQTEQHPLLRRYRRCVTLTHVSLVASLVSIVVGMYATSLISYAGFISGFLYICCLLAALIFSYMEMQTINHLKQRQQTASQ
jgi:spore germination protein KB